MSMVPPGAKPMITLADSRPCDQAGIEAPPSTKLAAVPWMKWRRDKVMVVSGEAGGLGASGAHGGQRLDRDGGGGLAGRLGGALGGHQLLEGAAEVRQRGVGHHHLQLERGVGV